ncbi:membrane hypothetical protein [Vibrio crassostreae]|uniref:Uncharacterized protein n=1 Tax=Vibrio crassostreae TaxID=246167 RepID=A0ABM9QSM4_9VIBR|nr:MULTISPECIES: hypothetical protein [Vibrio]TCL30872.1 hypothetical protein EDB52_1011161 [Vibrio crassostreae]TCT44371.1 hypothetical protein EDB29_1011183 [Vibrio crassostreae]TCT52992.1 hypothetical protein EDB39_10154 [Vibrio crassostreae]TCT63867.1 hypothetical protein EDB40_101364 [Vibrio crassostreae]CAK1762699.1 membrane hypothetical protein [Vibrio crassostreae]
MIDYEKRFEEFQALTGIGQTILQTDDNSQFQHFNTLIDELTSFANASPKKWLSFGESYLFWLYFQELGRQKDISAYLLHVKKRQNFEKDDKAVEILSFLEVEILMFNGSVNDSNEGRVKELYQKYPFNPDFKHSYAHVAKKTNKEEALRLYKECIQDWDCKELIRQKNNLALSLMAPGKNLGIDFAEYLVRDTHELELGICKDHFEKREYSKAKERLHKIKSDPIYGSIALLSVTNQAFENLIYTREYIDSEAIAKQALIEKEVKELNKTNVETLGVFSAIITFIITAALAMFKDESALSPIYMIGIGLILIVFILTMQLTTNPIQIKKEDGKGGVIALIRNDFRATILGVYTSLVIVTLAVTAFYIQPKEHEIEKLIERAKIELSAESKVQLNTVRRSGDQIIKNSVKTLDETIREKENIFKSKLGNVSHSNVVAFESEIVDFSNSQESKFRKEVTSISSVDGIVKDLILENTDVKINSK